MPVRIITPPGEGNTPDEDYTPDEGYTPVGQSALSSWLDRLMKNITPEKRGDDDDDRRRRERRRERGRSPSTEPPTNRTKAHGPMSWFTSERFTSERDDKSLPQYKFSESMTKMLRDMYFIPEDIIIVLFLYYNYDYRQDHSFDKATETQVSHAEWSTPEAIVLDSRLKDKFGEGFLEHLEKTMIDLKGILTHVQEFPVMNKLYKELNTFITTMSVVPSSPEPGKVFPLPPTEEFSYQTNKIPGQDFRETVLHLKKLFEANDFRDEDEGRARVLNPGFDWPFGKRNDADGDRQNYTDQRPIPLTYLQEYVKRLPDNTWRMSGGKGKNTKRRKSIKRRKSNKRRKTKRRK